MKRTLQFCLLIAIISVLPFSLIAQNFEWAIGLGGNKLDQGKTIATDYLGNVYTMGIFRDTVDFDPGSGVYNLATSIRSIFILKLDAFGNFIWARQLNSLSGGIFSGDMYLDASGGVYTVGFFNGTGNFDPGPGTFNLVSAGCHDIFISKLDSYGDFAFAKRFGGGSCNAGNDITLDANGNIYTTGYFEGTADFNPGQGTYNITSLGSPQNVFISKLDSFGNFVWAKRIGGTGRSIGNSIITDAAGNVYTTGRFQGTADFDPGPGVYNLTSAAPAGSFDIFISKLDSNGNFIWAKAMGGTGLDSGNSITIDIAGNVYTTGHFSGTVDFDPGPGIFNLTAVAGTDIFISKLDSNGNFLWAKTVGGTGNNYGNTITTDMMTNVYITGRFRATVDFDPGPETYYLASAGADDAFISKLDSNGNFLWAKSIGGTGNDSGSSITTDGIGNFIYTTGSFSGTADFDPGSHVYNLTSAGNTDIFIHKMSQCTAPAIAAVLSATASQPAPNCDGTATASASGGVPPYTYAWSNGETGESISGLCAGMYELTITDSGGCAKVDSVSVQLVTSITSQSTPETINVYPNPSAGHFTIETGGMNIRSISVYNSLGKRVLTLIPGIDQSPDHVVSLNLSSREAGIYLLIVELEGNIWHTERLVLGQ